ncbi:ABC transporter permease [Pseudidiomarina andamanensis]|uniref:ABC transporter permease n=2 Tax=Bacteria TaxID=2 RepID=A0AA92EQL2_9GAMM|nr:ABC transporter permease [Pseudidiomarina andamanensis]ADI48590.1 putative ABC-type dipeptide transport system permease component [uncultured bacterium fss6]MDS0218241.1 ABC transporter permease [Pseudidiomarina andamanensis]QGT95127.1 ABC transporter permease [Pseudidiomarina andamanensis]
MLRYSLRRIVLLLVTLWLLSLLIFSLNYWYPGDSLTNMTGIASNDTLAYQQAQVARGFDDGIISQYGQFVSHLFQGDWGLSLVTQQPVFDEIKPLLGATVELGLLAMLLAMVLGIPLGVYAAVQQRGPIDRVIMGISLSAYSIPVFWLAQLFILLFAVKLGWSPISGQINPLYAIETQTGSILIDIWLSDTEFKAAALSDALNHLWVPVIVLAIMPLTMLIRIMRNAVLDVLQQNFIKAARARGLSDATIMFRHTLPNALQPVIRQLGLQFSVLMTNIVITEVIFNWPGLGSWLVKSIYERDFPVIQAGLLILASLILFVNVLVDLVHAWRYPQVRKEIDAE